MYLFLWIWENGFCSSCRVHLSCKIISFVGLHARQSIHRLKKKIYLKIILRLKAICTSYKHASLFPMWNHKGGSSKFGDSLCSYCRYIQPSSMWVLVIECFRFEILFCTLCYLYIHSMICFLLSFKTLRDNHYYYFYLSSIHEVKHALWLLDCNSIFAYSLMKWNMLYDFFIVLAHSTT